MTESVPVNCPYCGEPAELDVDEGGGSKQTYVQDCPVCCRPWHIHLTRNADGEWTATLRTEDE